jgi:hypothetical protein
MSTANLLVPEFKCPYSVVSCDGDDNACKSCREDLFDAAYDDWTPEMRARFDVTGEL